MRPHFLVYLAALATAEEASQQSIIERDVAIIGGGSAGTYAAIALKDRGKSVIVIEKDSILGGQTDTYIDKDNGKHVNVGVQVLHNDPLVKSYVSDRLGVPLSTINGGLGDSIHANFDNGQLIIDVPPSDPQALRDAAERYIFIYRSRFAYLEDGAGASKLPFPVPEELLSFFPTWAEENNVTALVPICDAFLQNIGNILNATTVDVLKAFPPSLVTSLFTGFQSVASGDHQDMYTAAAKVLSGQVFYNSVPISIHRPKKSRESVRIVLSTPNGKKTILAKKLIVAIAPVPENVVALDLSRNETSLFARWRSLGYFSGVIEYFGINGTITNFDPSNPYGFAHLPGIYMFSPNVAGKVTFYGGSLFPISTRDAQQLLSKQIKTLESTGVISPAEWKLKFITNHSPFRLRADEQDIRKGFYRDLYGLQGKKETFWTGAAWAAQDSTLIWQYTEKQVVPSVIAALEGREGYE